MFFALHKLKHCLLGSKFIFYVDHMALVYLVNKPQVLGRITKCLLLFFKYDFAIMYKPSRTNVVVDALSRLLDITKPTCVFNQITYVSLIYIEPEWLNDVKDFLRT
jgi:hypothetical protein